MLESNPLEDYKKIIAAIVEQSMMEYIKLQHPKARKKKYLLNAFANAIDIFFLPSYTFAYFFNSDGSNMNLHDLIIQVTDTSSPNLEEMKKHLIHSAYEHWSKKYVPTLTIPDCLIYKGHVYVIEHSDSNHSVNHEEKSIQMNRQQNLENEKIFVEIVFNIIDKVDPEASPHEAFYEILKMNQIQINY